jgi:hypothetical protein
MVLERIAQLGDERRRDHLHTGLLQLGVLPAEILRQLRELAQTGLPLRFACVFEDEHILDADAPMPAGFAKRELALVEQTNEVLAAGVHHPLVTHP